MSHLSKSNLNLAACSLLLVAFLAAVPHAAAQTHGYGFLGAATPADGAFRYGIGGNWAFTPHATLGAEVGGMKVDGFNGTVASGNAGYHIHGRVDEGLDPFVTGGFTIVRMGGETSAFANLGGGLQYWFHPRAAFRVEFRGYLGGQDVSSFSEFRFGLALR